MQVTGQQRTGTCDWIGVNVAGQTAGLGDQAIGQTWKGLP
jgi:hypothetical protein